MASDVMRRRMLLRMAKIVRSKNAPSEDFSVSFGVGLVELKGKTPAESDDRALLSECANHPWLEVQWDKVEMLGGDVVPPKVDPKKDPLSIQNPDNALVNDPDTVRAAQRKAAEVAPAAIDPDLDQDKVKVEAGVDKTVAAALKSNDDEKASK